MTQDREMMPGLVSVIVPVFNRMEMLLEAVACVAAQTYPEVELILVDDGSTDGTAELCDRLGSERAGKTKVLHQENGGPGTARETGRRAARGEYIQYLDSDDWLDPGKLERQVAVLEEWPDAGVCYCITRERLPDGSVVGRSSMRTGELLDSIFPAFLEGRLWQTVTPLWRRSASDRIGEWTSLRVEEDMEYDARAGARGVRLVWCPESLAEHRHHGGERASGGGPLDAGKMRNRARAHSLIYRHALDAGVSSAQKEMQRFARELFLLARQCGAAGLPEESKELFALACGASSPKEGRGLDLRFYRLLATAFGWERAGGLACRLDGLRAKGERAPE